MRIHRTVITQIITLTTSGFGLVAALAWNNVIQDLVNEYIKPYLPSGSGLVSLVIYALIVTILAVVITTHLSNLAKRYEDREIEVIVKKTSKKK